MPLVICANYSLARNSIQGDDSSTAQHKGTVNMDYRNITVPHTNRTDFSSAFTHKVLPVLYSLICVAGLVLNLLAAWIFLWVPCCSGLVVYLKNMLVADLLMLASFPWRVAGDLGLGGWRLHVVVCRYSAVLFYSSMYAGIVFLGLISLERYVKIVHASGAPSSASALLQSVSVARALSALTWCLIAVTALPNSLLTSQQATEENARHCMRLKTPLGVQWHRVSTFLCVSIFWATFALLCFCYTSIARRVYQSYRRVRKESSEAHRKSNRSIFSILLVFFLCFVPYHVCRVPYTISQTSGVTFSERGRFLLFQVKEGTLFLSAFNVCLDPIIYFLMCRTFRELLLRKFSRSVVEGRRQSFTTVHSVNNI
ncbi:hypothetical protein AAFF_G00186060 [Aldrovandia affinis]|uniref:G-protein coupled receptors family 1 profile domain-containing protein n=1 Tax=Aldrovandia affinis TaxID=143900 RepID=A0AAD7SXL5_9TELE|nr:hypothetical protein AAFF_G00186060 [Aldrovandia affinis]